jgi:dTDP-4-dehydrorhamnose reductase
MKILITGGNGMVARAAKRIFQAAGDEVISFSKEDLDISDAEAVNQALSSVKPDAVMNCAAYTNVDGCESNEALCFAVNSTGVGNLASASKRVGARFATISTDYVFDGGSFDFYTENDFPNPISVYGKSKLEGERRALEANEESIIVRSGWIYGQGGTNFLSIIADKLLQGDSITAISDSFGTPTFADDLCRAIRSLLDANATGIFHVANEGEGTSYHGFAVEVAKALKVPTDLVSEISEKQLSRPAPRPTSSKLRSARLSEIDIEPLSDWKEALAGFLNSK